MPTWPDQIRRSAGVDPSEESSPYLSQLSGGHRRTQVAAAEYGRHVTKRDVQEFEPTPGERWGLMVLFALQASEYARLEQ